MKKTVVFFLGLFIVEVFFAQAIKQKHESDITGAKQQYDNLSDFLPLSKSANTIKDAIYADITKSASERTEDLIRRLTFEEKLSLTGGFNRFQVAPIPRLGIRPAFMADASQGVRMQTLTIKGKSTSFPGMLPLASTWNSELANAFGKAMGEECKALGVDILLGPGINMQRLSVGGRNFEYMGEDPLLTSVIASNYVEGMESTGVLSCPKHFIANDQEFCRHIANVVVSERALREIYLPPWKAVIQKGHASAIMTGNNLVNEVPAPINKLLNADILRKEYGFKGIAMTDWQNTNYFPMYQQLVLPSGETLLMPDNGKFASWVQNEIKTSPTRKAEVEILLENMIYPTLYTLFKKGVYDRLPQDESFMPTLNAHKEIARKTAEESIVLLKNEKNILPITTGKSIVMIGKPEIHSGQGSGSVQGYDHITFAQGLKSAYGEKFTYLKELDLEAIKRADVVIFNLNKRSGEGRDTPFDADIEELVVLKRITAINKNVIVLMNSCNVMPMQWLKDVKGLLWCYFLGQERGNALANIVSGKVSPSGKLPFTIEKSFLDSPDPQFNFIGGKPYWGGNNQYKKYWLGEETVYDTVFTNYVKPFQTIPINYKEETLIGYRWYDYHKIPVHFPFGFGLSYTKFKINTMNVENRMASDGTIYVEVEVQNIGNMKAKEVVQIYVSDKQSSVIRAPKELKAFRKTELKPGEKASISFILDKSALAFWDELTNNWKLESGEFILSAGNSSANLTKQSVLVIE